MGHSQYDWNGGDGGDGDEEGMTVIPSADTDRSDYKTESLYVGVRWMGWRWMDAGVAACHPPDAQGQCRPSVTPDGQSTTP